MKRKPEEPRSALDLEIQRQQRELDELRARLQRAEDIIDLQNQLCDLFGLKTEPYQRETKPGPAPAAPGPRRAKGERQTADDTRD